MRQRIIAIVILGVLGFFSQSDGFYFYLGKWEYRICVWDVKKERKKYYEQHKEDLVRLGPTFRPCKFDKILQSTLGRPRRNE